MPRVRCWAWLAMVISLIAIGCQPDMAEWKRLDPPVPAPDFTLSQLDGGRVSLSGLRGRVVIMEFWATWCGPCRYSSPSLEAIYKKFRDRGVTVLLINAGEGADKVRKWAEHRFTAPILLDTEGEVAHLYHVEGIPRLLLIDQQGRILYDHAGYAGGLEDGLNVILKGLLTDSSTDHG